jgi:hypothetical protein
VNSEHDDRRDWPQQHHRKIENRQPCRTMLDTTVVTVNLGDETLNLLGNLFLFRHTFLPFTLVGEHYQSDLLTMKFHPLAVAAVVCWSSGGSDALVITNPPSSSVRRHQQQQLQ